MKITMIFKNKKGTRFLLRPENQRPRCPLAASPNFSRVSQLAFLAQHSKQHGSVKRSTDNAVGQYERQHVHGLHEVADVSRENKREKSSRHRQPGSRVTATMGRSLCEVAIVLPAHHEVASNQNDQNARLHVPLLSRYWIMGRCTGFTRFLP